MGLWVIFGLSQRRVSPESSHHGVSLDDGASVIGSGLTPHIKCYALADKF
jgi:hypothetical protein